MWQVLWTVFVWRVLYGALKATLSLRGRIMRAPRSECEYRQFREAVCKVYRDTDGSHASQLVTERHGWRKTAASALTLALAVSLVAWCEQHDNATVPVMTTTQRTDTPFLHQLLQAPMAECRDASFEDTHCAVDAQWEASGGARHFFSDEDERVWFSTTDAAPRLWREDQLAHHDAAGCVCADELGLRGLLLLRHEDARWLVLYDAQLVRVPSAARQVQSTRQGVTRSHANSVVVEYSAPRQSPGGAAQTLLRDYNRRARPHNWTVLARLQSERPRLELQGEAAACFSHCMG